MIYLASSGDEAKIWDVPSFSLLEEFNPYQGSVSDITWSHDGYSIASCCSADQTVYVRLTKTAQSIPADSFVLPSGCQCLDYNSSSRFLLCGCADGSLHIWDRKPKVIKKSRNNFNHPVTVARWNWNDTYISVGLENGNILLYNVATNQISSPLVAPSVNTIRQLRYNPYQKSSLVSVSEDGAVNLWDTNTRRLLHAFTKTHQAPARDLVFSPINDYLMVSVGLDKRAVFYDVQNKSPVKTVVAEHPLTSVEMMHDGTTIVVGTTRGKIFFYDMRQSSTPVHNFTAHKSSVKHLSFVRQENEKNDSSSQSLRRQLPTTPFHPTDAQDQNSSNTHYQTQRNNSNLATYEIFSPVSHANMSSNSITEKTSSEKSWMQNLSKSQIGDIFSTGDGVFSPLRHDNSQSINNSTHNRSSILSNNSFLTQILGPIESSSKDQVNNYSNNLLTTENVNKIKPATTNENSHQTKAESSSESSPKLLLQKGIGASPSLQQLPSQRSDNTDSASFPSRASPSNKAPSRFSPASTINTSLTPGRVSFDDRPEVLGAASMNGGTSLKSPRDTQVRSDHSNLTDQLTAKSGENCGTTLSPRSSNKSQLTATKLPLEPASLSSPSSNIASVRQLVQDILREQFQEHQEHLKAEIRSMLGHQSYNSLGASQTSNSANLPSQPNPGLFQAEFIRNLIRDELEDVKDFIHKEFWCVQVELIKQVFQLQKRIEAGLAECTINPLLLDEIDRLREENTRLRKTF